MSLIPPIQTEKDLYDRIMSLLSRDIENVRKSEKHIKEFISASMASLHQAPEPTTYQLVRGAETDSMQRCVTNLLDYLSNLLQDANTKVDQFTYAVKHVVRSAEQVFNIQVYDTLSPALRLVPETIVLFFPDINIADQISIVVAASVRRLKFRKLSGEEAKALDVSIGKTYPSLTQEYEMAVEKARQKIRGIISENQNAPEFLRLAWNSATIRFKEELENSAGNKRLEHAIELLDIVKEKFPILSSADIYQLAGVVAVEYSGGPSVNFHPGRVDNDAPPEEQLPRSMISVSVAGIRKCFSRMGFSEEEFVTLAIPYSLGRCSEEDSGFWGFWTADGLKFDNSFFKVLTKNSKSGFDKLRLDHILSKDPIFSRVVSRYIEDEDAFFDDYALAHMKFSELGFADD